MMRSMRAIRSSILPIWREAAAMSVPLSAFFGQMQALADGAQRLVHLVADARRQGSQRRDLARLHQFRLRLRSRSIA